MYVTELHSTQVEKLSGKMMHGEEYAGLKGFGYLYNVHTTESLCGIALIHLQKVIADATCVPRGFEPSNLRAVFIDSSFDYNVQLIHIFYPKYVKEEKTNTTLAVIPVSTSTTMQCFKF